MKTQMYYLLPDTEHTHQAYDDLARLNVPQDDVHLVMKQKTPVDDIEDIHSLSETDRDYFRDWFLWRVNLAIFALSLCAFVFITIWNPSIYLLIPFLIMLGTFISGVYFTIHLPNSHWNEFESAVKHGKVLMIIDVPESDVTYIDNYIHQRHPEAINGETYLKV